MPEYGRNIQKMVDHMAALKDRDERNRAAKTLIDIMGNLQPHLRDVADFKHKLWDHLAIMADFKLDIDYPYNPPSPSMLHERPNRVPYNQHQMKYRHYGYNVGEMITEATKFEEGPDKEYLIEMLANHMKKSYLTWNKDSVSDDKIMKDLYELSYGKINKQEMQLADTKNFLNRSGKPKKTPSSFKHKKGESKPNQ